MSTSSSDHRHDLARRGMCPDCGEEYTRLAMHWKGPCSPPPLSGSTLDLLAGLLLGDGFVGGNGANKHFHLSTRWRPFAAWLFDELGWLASRVTRVDHPSRPEPNQQYLVHTHAHPSLTRFREWYPVPGIDAAAPSLGGTRSTNSPT